MRESRLSKMFYIISQIPVPPFIRITYIGIIEAFLNLITCFRSKNYKFPKKKSKLAIITGGTKGIGKEIVNILVSCNYDVHILARDVTAMKELKKTHKKKVNYTYCDLTHPKQIIKVVEKLKYNEIDLLINNAGVYHRKVFKKYGIEYNFLINHLSHYILTKEILKKSKVRRVVNVSSSAMYCVNDFKYKKYDFLMDNYGRSKLCNALHSLYLKSVGVESVCVHPGIIPSGLFDNTWYGTFVKIFKLMFPFLFYSPREGALNVVFACFAKDLFENREKVDMYVRYEKAKVPGYLNIVNAVKLYEYTEKMCDKLLKN